MMPEPELVDSEAAGLSSAHFVHTLMQFAIAVRHRKHIIGAALLVAILLGGLYYATATRYYGAKAGILVLQVGSDTWSAGATQRNLEQTVLPTYENLFSRACVIEGAFKYLQPEDRIDLAAQPQDKWVQTIQKNLSVRSLRNTNILEVSYASRDPHAAVAVVNAVVQSYLEFMEKTYKGTASEIIEVLTRERVQLAQQLAIKQQELLRAQQAMGDLGIPTDSKVLHPVVQRAVALNDELCKAQFARVQLEATMAAVQGAVRNGEDLQQYLLSIEDAVGQQILLATLGFSSNDAATQAKLETDLLTCRTQLQELQKHFGDNHPRVMALMDQIRTTEQYAMGYREHVRQRLGQFQDGELAPLMLQMVQQRLNQARQLESSLAATFNRAAAEAVGLNGQLAQVGILEHDLKWLRDLHDVLLNRIASIDLKHEGLDVRTTKIDEPVVELRPVSPKLLATVLCCFTVGLGVGLLIVYLMDILDDHFRSVEAMQTVLGVPVLALIQQLSSSDAVGVESLQIVAAPEAAESEAFRTLRTALSLSNQETRRLVVSSAEPGDGKTTVLANLAAAFAQSQKRTLLIDADLRRPGLTAVLGMRGMEGLSGIIRGEEEVSRMAAGYIQASGVQGLDVLPSGPRPSNPAELLASPRFAELLAWAEGVYDQLLIDSPPALAASDTAVIGRLIDGVMLVVQPAKNRRRVLLRTVETFTLLKIPVVGAVVNRTGANKGYDYGYGGYGYDYQANDEPASDAAIPSGTDELAALYVPPSQAAAPSQVVPRRAA
jgi:capsular exopolysaccharide synthesis family protein